MNPEIINLNPKISKLKHELNKNIDELQYDLRITEIQNNIIIVLCSILLLVLLYLGLK